MRLCAGAPGRHPERGAESGRAGRGAEGGYPALGATEVGARAAGTRREAPPEVRPVGSRTQALILQLQMNFSLWASSQMWKPQP